MTRLHLFLLQGGDGAAGADVCEDGGDGECVDGNDGAGGAGGADECEDGGTDLC